MDQILVTNSPATKAILGVVTRQLALPYLDEVAKKTGNQAKIILQMLDDYVNPSAQITENQTVLIANLVFDKWSSRPFAPTPEELMMLATYINSCRT